MHHTTHAIPHNIVHFLQSSDLLGDSCTTTSLLLFCSLFCFDTNTLTHCFGYSIIFHIFYTLRCLKFSLYYRKKSCQKVSYIALDSSSYLDGAIYILYHHPKLVESLCLKNGTHWRCCTEGEPLHILGICFSEVMNLFLLIRTFPRYYHWLPYNGPSLHS